MENKQENRARELYGLIREADRTVVTAHSHPDGDALGSSLAMVHFIRESMGGDACAVLPDQVPSQLRFLTEPEEGRILFFHDSDPQEAERRIQSSDLIICLDCNAFNRTGDLEGLFTGSQAKKVLIDHHLNPDIQSFDLVFSETEISSACELLFRILMEMPSVHGDARLLPPSSATCLMAGMTTDTNNFANSVFPSTLAMASELLGAGVDRDALILKLYNNYPESRIRIMGFMLDERLKITGDGLAYMILDKEDMERFNVEEGDTDGFVNIPLSVGKVRMSIFLREDKGFYRVSVRSREGTSANGIAMKWFNGGGHELAAGGKIFIPKDIKDKSEAGDYILRASKEFLD